MAVTAAALQRLGIWSSSSDTDDVAPAEIGTEAHDELAPLVTACIYRYKLMARRLADARYADCDWTESLAPSPAAPLGRLAHAALCLQLHSRDSDRWVVLELFVEQAVVRVGPLAQLLVGAEWVTLSERTCAVIPTVADSSILEYLRCNAHRRYHSRTFNCQHFAVALHEQLQRWSARQVHPFPPVVLGTALFLSQQYGSALSSALIGVCAVVWLLLQACDPAKSRLQLLLWPLLVVVLALAGTGPRVDNDVD